jgi:RNA recognition motif-containing protein
MKNTIEQILLFLYFPQFKSQNCSRFESFFQTIQANDISLMEGNLQRSKMIYPEKIIRNEDKRTSLIIRGIPTDLTKKEIRNLIEKYGNINYLYVTKTIKSKEQLSSIAYINVINYRTIIPLFMNLRNVSFIRDGKLYKLKIMYSAAQGKKQLKQYIKGIYFYEYLE